MEIKGKTVLVAGAGISGKNASRLLLAEGARVILYDGNTGLDLEALREELGHPDVLSFAVGELTPRQLSGIGLCVISPGIPLDAPVAQQLREAGIPIWGEVELAYRASRGKLAAITGTNGKTTTTALTGKICRDYQPSVFVVGNIGNAYTSEALKTGPESITVAEVSSFQLETIQEFHPQVSAILNITPDHLNRHKTMENYARIKERITENQGPEDVCVLNYEDLRLRAFGATAVPRVLFFSSRQELPEGAWLAGDEIFLRLAGKKERVCGIHEMNLLGVHNYENVMAAVLMGVSLGIPLSSIRKSIGEFQAVEHRIEFVTEKNGVAYYNDSKGTNTDAAIQAIRAMVRPTLLIAGGYDKEAEYDQWIQEALPHTRQMILLGATAEKIGKTAEKYGIPRISYVESLEEAVRLAAESAEPGDAVLLSPACASWDMFPNYEVRGRRFKELAQEL